MSQAFANVPQITCYYHRYDCADLDAGKIKPEAFDIVSEFVFRLNGIRNSIWTRNPWWIYIFAFCFIVSFIIVCFFHKNILFVIPLVFLCLFVLCAIVVCIYDSKVESRVCGLIQEYRVKLASHYIVVDRAATTVKTPNGTYEFKDLNMVRNSIKLIPIEQAFMMHAQDVMTGEDAFNQQEKVVLYEPKNNDMPIYKSDLNKTGELSGYDINQDESYNVEGSHSYHADRSDSYKMDEEEPKKFNKFTEESGDDIAYKFN